MEDFISTDGAAARLGVHARTVRRWAKDGRIPGAVQYAGAWHIPEDEVDPRLRRPPAGPEHDLYRAAVALLDLLEQGGIPHHIEGALTELRVVVELCFQPERYAVAEALRAA
jgi:excisionase family DNA binding protein